jgi:hypothetical protein
MGVSFHSFSMPLLPPWPAEPQPQPRRSDPGFDAWYDQVLERQQVWWERVLRMRARDRARYHRELRAWEDGRRAMERLTWQAADQLFGLDFEARGPYCAEARRAWLAANERPADPAVVRPDDLWGVLGFERTSPREMLQQRRAERALRSAAGLIAAAPEAPPPAPAPAPGLFSAEQPPPRPLYCCLPF